MNRILQIVERKKKSENVTLGQSVSQNGRSWKHIIEVRHKELHLMMNYVLNHVKNTDGGKCEHNLFHIYLIVYF